MTHDELLACVKPEYAYGSIGDALRAVIELHKPNRYGYCDCTEFGVNENDYPCDTIQTIEKELG